MDIPIEKTLLVLLVLFASSRRNVAASSRGIGDSGVQMHPDGDWDLGRISGFPAPPMREASQGGPAPFESVGSQAANVDVREARVASGSNFYTVPSRSDVLMREHPGSSQTPRGGLAKNVQGVDTVCSNGLRLAFDCALKRVVTFGIRDYLVTKYRLPMVPLDVCQRDTVVDVEQCIPDDFMNAFPSDTLLEVVRQKRLTVGTIDLSVFPQLASDQGNTSGFYPELVQAVAREITVIVLQNPGLRQELLGDRQFDISIIEQPLSKRTRDAKVAMAGKWFYGELCEAKANVGVHDPQQLPVSSAEHHASSGESVAGKEGQATTWQNGLLCGDSTLGVSACYFSGCWSPWEGIPKDILIQVTYVRFSTPMNLIAAVHRGEVHMTDVGTIASAYLPEKYNFLPLREVLEPSCTIGAWKSFFLSRDSAGKRKREWRGMFDFGQTTVTQPSASGDETTVRSSGLPRAAPTRGDLEAYASNDHEGKGVPEDQASDGRQPSGVLEPQSSEVPESWELELMRIRRLFFKLYGVQADGAYTTSSHTQEPVLPVPSGSTGWTPGRSSETETAYEEKTLVKLHHVDHFTFAYLFPEEFRICSVRKLTDLVSLLSDGEPIGAFGYGLAGRGGRRRTLWGSRWHCSPQQVRIQRALGAGLRRDGTGSLLESRIRALCDGQSVARRSLQDEGHPYVMEFPGPLVPLAAFFAKSRDPVCRGHRQRTVAAVVEEPTAPSSAAESKALSHFVVLGVLMTVLLASA